MFRARALRRALTLGRRLTSIPGYSLRSIAMIAEIVSACKRAVQVCDYEYVVASGVAKGRVWIQARPSGGWWVVFVLLDEAGTSEQARVKQAW